MKLCTEVARGRPVVVTAELEKTLRDLGLNLHEVCRKIFEERKYVKELYYYVKWAYSRKARS